MYRTHCVLALLALYAGMAHSFSWEIVTTVGYSNRLDFYDINGTLTHTENITYPSGKFENIIYDPVHDRLLFADSYSINSFEIATKKTECLISNSSDFAPLITDLAYDPATELLFWTENNIHLYSISIKPGFNNSNVNEKQLISLDEVWIVDMDVDSCEGFIYYYYYLALGSVKPYARVRFDGSEREVLIDNITDSICFDNDQKSHKMYWYEYSEPQYNDGPRIYKVAFKYSDLNRQNVTTINKSVPQGLFSFTASREYIYLLFNYYEYGNYSIWKIPKNDDFDTEPKLFIENDRHISAIATKYNIEDITRGHQNCDTLKSLLPNNSVSTNVSLLCVHGTKVSGESRCECAQGYSGERCDVSVCHNYCLYGDCSASAEGQPTCRCNAGYSGERCEVNACQSYCLNDGVCSLSEESKPVCQCTGGHEGGRCEVPAFLTKSVQTVSILRDLLNKDVTSVLQRLQLFSEKTVLVRNEHKV